MTQTSALDRLDRRTWPEVLSRTDLAAIYGCTVRQIFRMRVRGELPRPLPGPLAWSKTEVCQWLDDPRRRLGCRVPKGRTA